MKKNLSSLLAASALLAACGPSAGTQDSQEKDLTGGLTLSLTSVPTDVSCLKIDVVGSRTVSEAFDIDANSSNTFKLSRLPVGLVNVSAKAFATACKLVKPADEPAYVTESPASVRIQPSVLAELILKLLRNGRLSVGIDFETDEYSCGTCDDKNECTTDTCTAGVCAFTPVADGKLCQGGNLRVKLLAFNDFHGQLSAGRLVSGRPVGGAQVMAAYLKAASAGFEDQTLIVHAGDHVGASPPASALLQDEPSISFLNMLANSSCTYANKANPACNMVGTLGNHEFDEGSGELLRLLDGGKFSSGPFLEDPYQGARFPYVSANVVNEITGQPLLPPYVIKTIKGVKVAFVGAVLKATPTIVTPTGVAGLKFLDEATAANSYVPELKKAGVKALVLLIHQGGTQSSYVGPTKTTGTTINGADILDVVKRLDSEFDVVVSGHAHAFTNALVNNSEGKSILVTQAFSASTAYADIDLTVSPATGDVVTKTASVITTFADVAPGTTPVPDVAALVAAAEGRVAPLINRVEGFAAAALSRAQNAAGESPLGNVIADAQRAAMGTQFAFMNPGGIRADLNAGDITWGELFTIQPFGNSLVKLQMTGAQIKLVLEQQWAPPQTFARIMAVSGLKYTWDNALPPGNRVVQVLDAATELPLDPAALYTVACNNFMATGGDNFSAFTLGLNAVGGPIDLDALVDWVHSHNPLTGANDGRIKRLN
ncbi:MAG: bifunctional metallophosphatase/5'-nucleotidase [Deltaproteobacteria bacterium]|nr:bifunctional metallophosphatase/5'-nucleotidase [Deltaproteobacteria bacterium]